MPKPKVLVADPIYTLDSSPLDESWQELNNRFSVVINPKNRTLTKKELISLGADCVGIIAGSEKFDAPVFSKLKALRVISRTGAGMENIDLKVAKRKKIAVLNCADVMTEPTAELAIGLLFSILRRIPRLNNEMHMGTWSDAPGITLAGKTVGIIGAGKIGQKVGEILKNFDCKVLANKTHPDEVWSKKTGISFVTKDEIYATSDIIFIFLPASPENKHLINRNAFVKMKTGVILISLGRGSVINEDDLIAALNSGKVYRAALDVFEVEPYQGKLMQMKNVILTPHIGGATTESRQESKNQAVKNLLNAL